MNAATLRNLFLSGAVLLSLTSCGGTALAGGSQNLTLLPQDCQLTFYQTIGFALNGEIDPGSSINWTTDLGSLVKNSQGTSAVYTAPPVAGEALIKATVTSGLDGEVTELTATCKIIDPNITLPPATSIPPSTPLQAPELKPTIIISEVMGNPCGGVEERRYNQYIELYNYGNQPVDVGGWRFFDEGEFGTPDELTAWSSRVNILFDPNLIMSATLIPPGGIALILPPQYHLNPLRSPYIIPPGTILLTIAQSETIGDDYFGIIADQEGYDTLTLYIGGATVIEKVVDTYGTPTIKSNYPIDIDDDRKDNIPNYLSECTSIERIDPLQPDIESNWRPVTNGSPGEVPFK